MYYYVLFLVLFLFSFFLLVPTKSMSVNTSSEIHPHLHLSAKSLKDLQIKNVKQCFISSLPLQLLSKPILKSKLLFAQFGDIIHIRIHQKSISSTHKRKNNECITITFNNQESAQSAIKWINSSIFKFKNKNQDTIYWKSKSMNGLTKYCHSFIFHKRCFNDPCYYRHSLCHPNHIISYKQYQIFKGLTFFLSFCL